VRWINDDRWYTFTWSGLRYYFRENGRSVADMAGGGTFERINYLPDIDSMSDGSGDVGADLCFPLSWSVRSFLFVEIGGLRFRLVPLRPTLLMALGGGCRVWSCVEVGGGVLRFPPFRLRPMVVFGR
jgi:hypothetical protein